mmetsp:Transcript_96977/g.217305  ORF Transcript_96977/g.217305 Transcript_96977/m.217305 type:complete len:266 (-) Transcript_96977:39-836(-)
MSSSMASPILSSLSSVLHAFAAVPWLEEAGIITAIGVAFILTHKFYVVSARRPSEGRKLASLKEDAGSCFDDPVKPRLTRRVRDSERRMETGVSRAPVSCTEMPGITDRRFMGRIVSYKEDEGYGFISCPDLYPRFQRDVFLHKYQIGKFGVDSFVSFGVFLNKNGHPQAKDLETPVPLPLPLSWQGWNPVAAPFEMPAKRQPLNPHAKPFQTQIGVATEDAAMPPPCISATVTTKEVGKAAGEKRWVPKAPQGKLQWVPKKAAA